MPGGFAMTDFEAALTGRKETGLSASRAGLLVCFALAVLAMLPTQLYRLNVEAPLPWLLADYAGRIMAIGVLIALPAGRWCLRQKDELKVGTLEAGAWVLGIVLLLQFTPVADWLSRWFPASALGAYPAPTGFLFAVHITFGLVLLALHEELIFRKLADRMLRSFGWGFWGVTLASAVLFALFHWWRGPAGMIGAALYGLLAMACYRRTGSLWPIGFTHYLLNYLYFA